jgi:Fur family transcriptional regulator, peroxide stress response regulator
VHGFENLKNKLMEETGFTISSYRLDFFGLCPACREK